jgi:hypothetical protein
MLVNFVNVYKKSLEKGALTLPLMQPKNKKDTPALKQRINQLEKSLEKANTIPLSQVFRQDLLLVENWNTFMTILLRLG